MFKTDKLLKKRYEGLSLVETLLTIVIITTVMLLASVTLTTLIKASAVSAARTTAREESEFILELLRRTIRNSHNDDILLYNVSGRAFDEDSGVVVADGDIGGYEVSLNEAQVGNEIHFRPTGFDRWVCLGFFPGQEDPEIGYLLKSSSLSLDDPASCFDSATESYEQNAVVLNSTSIDVNYLEFEYFNTQGNNVLMTIEVEVEPTEWSEQFTGPVTPTYFKQAVVSTQKLSWE
jgi:hypothetical protein